MQGHSDAGSVVFRERVREAGRILADLSLVDRQNYWPQYVGMPKGVRGKLYRDEWAFYESRDLFDFELTDGALLQFKDRPEGHDDVSFCFYECPLDVDDYATFVFSMYGLTVEELGDEARDDYENYLSTAALKRGVTMIRYDYSPALYREGGHPASHLHIGHGSEIRLGAERILNPVSFVLFIVRQVYPAHWQRFISTAAAAERVRHVRDALPRVDAAYVKAKDAWEAYLT